MMNIKAINLMDNIDSYLYNAFTFGKNNIFDDKNKKNVNNLTSGVVLGDPVTVIADSNVAVYPLYEPKVSRSNYHYNSTHSALTTLIEDYIKPQGLAESIPNFEYLELFSRLQDQILINEFTSKTYLAYLKLISYLHLYKFNTKADDLIAFIEGKKGNVAVTNYMNYTNKYIVKAVSQPALIHSAKFGVVGVVTVDSHMQLVAKALANDVDIAVVHKGNFVMLCFSHKAKNKDEFIKLLTERYDQQGDFVTFFLDGVETDFIVSALERMI